MFPAPWAVGTEHLRAVYGLFSVTLPGTALRPVPTSYTRQVLGSVVRLFPRLSCCVCGRTGLHLGK